mgnify:CR=1 FL=1
MSKMCSKCMQTFATQRLFESHVCPGVNMKNPDKRRSYQASVVDFHRELTTNGGLTEAGRQKQELYEALIKVDDYEYYRILDLCGIQKGVGASGAASQLVRKGYKWDGKGICHSGVYSIMQSLKRMGKTKREQFLWGAGVLGSTDLKHSAAQLAKIGYEVSDGEIVYKERIQPGVASMWEVPDQISMAGSASGGVSWMEPMNTSSITFGGKEKEMADKALEDHIHQVCEEDELPVSQLNEVLRIVNKRGWIERVLANILINKGLSEEDLFPEDFEDEGG